MIAEPHKGDRRASERFPLERDVRFWILNEAGRQNGGTGRTVNMSSGGVLFTASNPIPPGRNMELSISWPAQLNAKCGLRLVARGVVVRCEPGLVAIRIRQHEFRTESTAPDLARKN
jgi:hypothetical protein